MFSRSFCEYITYTEAARKIIRHMRFSQFPDEMWSQSTIMNSPFRASVVADSKRLMLWLREGASNPLVLTMRDWDKITFPNYFFARKFDPAIDKEVIVKLADRVR
jgi:hypothetical protein